MNRCAESFAFDPPHYGCRGCGATVQQMNMGRERFLGTGQQLMLCGVCALAYLAPDFTDAALDAFYREHYRRLFLVDAARRHGAMFFRHVLNREFARKRVEQVLTMLPAGGRLLEVGSGFGAFLGQLHAVRPDVVLYAIEADAAHRAGLLDGAAVQFITPKVLAAHGPFDAIVAWHVVEHLKEPVTDLARYAQALTVEGKLVIEVPDAQADWRNWLYVQPAHVSYFSAPSLARVLVRAGMAVESIGAHPAGACMAGTVWAVAVRAASPVAPVQAMPTEVAQLRAHIARYGWNRRQAWRHWVRRWMIRLVGVNQVGAVVRYRYYRRNRGYFTRG